MSSGGCGFSRAAPGSLDIAYEVDCSGTSQAYLDTGNGFAEQHRQSFETSAGRNHIEVQLPAGPLKAFRIDPPACARRHKVRTIKLRGRWRQVTWKAPVLRSKIVDSHSTKLSSLYAGGAVIGPDPHLTFSMPGGITQRFRTSFWLAAARNFALTLLALALLQRAFTRERWEAVRAKAAELLLPLHPHALRARLTSARSSLSASQAIRLSLAVAVSCWIVYQLAPTTWARLSDARSRTGPLLEKIQTTSFEARRRAVYGECGGIAYGYLWDLMALYPATDSLPIIKYSDYYHSVELLLPGMRPRIDERVMVGIGISAEDFRETLIANAIERERDAHSSRWTFQTRLNYQQLTGLIFALSEPPTTPTQLRVALIDSPTDARKLAEWTVNIPAGASMPYSFHLPSPVQDFSIGRGATDFILQVQQTASDRRLVGIAIMASKVDGSITRW